MPWTAFHTLMPDGMNGFQIADFAMAWGRTSIGILIYTLFILAIMALIIGAILLSNKDVPIFIDWLIIGACIGGCVYFFSEPQVIIYSGIWTILIGVIIAIIFQLITHDLLKEEKQRKNEAATQEGSFTLTRVQE